MQVPQRDYKPHLHNARQKKKYTAPASPTLKTKYNSCLSACHGTSLDGAAVADHPVTGLLCKHSIPEVLAAYSYILVSTKFARNDASIEATSTHNLIEMQ